MKLLFSFPQISTCSSKKVQWIKAYGLIWRSKALSRPTVVVFTVSHHSVWGPEPGIVHSQITVFIWTLRLFTVSGINARNVWQSLLNNVAMPPPPSESPDHMIAEASVSSTHPVLFAGKAILTEPFMMGFLSDTYQERAVSK